MTRIGKPKDYYAERAVLDAVEAVVDCGRFAVTLGVELWRISGLDTPAERAALREMAGWAADLGLYVAGIVGYLLLTFVLMAGTLTMAVGIAWTFAAIAHRTWLERRRAACGRSLLTPLVLSEDGLPLARAA
jgi:hypothetical protein